MDSGKKKFIGITVIAVVVLAVLLAVLLRFLPSISESTLSQKPDSESVQTVNPQSGNLFDSEDEDITESATDAMPTLDTSGRMPATGEFVLSSVPADVDIVLDDSANDFRAIIEAIKSVDAAFSPEGYVVLVKDDSSSNGVHGNVRVQLYIDSIATSSCYTVVIDDNQIQYVNVMWAYHPSSVEMEQILQTKTDFENSAAGRATIEQAKSAIWPAGSTATQDKYSEEFYFDFQEDRLYLIITDDRRLNGVVDARQERIDVQKVLGR
jgi:hypothetical protein